MRVAVAEEPDACIRLGGLGTGWLGFKADGSFDSATVAPLASPVDASLRGSFAALWTQAGSQTTARILSGSSAWGMPAARQVSCTPRFPLFETHVADTDLPVTVSATAFSAVHPFDEDSSTLPVVLLIYRLKNVARAPARVSILVSWGCLLGSTMPVGQNGESEIDVRWLAAQDGILGIRLEGPALDDAPADHLSCYNTRGTQALLGSTEEGDVQAFRQLWTPSNGPPAWWKQFAQNGSLPELRPAEAISTSRRVAACLALRTELAANEEQEFAFALAWHTPRVYDRSSHCWAPVYTRRYRDASAAGHWALENRSAIRILSEEWQQPFLRDPALTPWLLRLAEELGEFVSRSFFAYSDEHPTSSRRFVLLDTPDDRASRLTWPLRIRLQPCLLSLFPQLDAADIALCVSERVAAEPDPAQDSAAVHLAAIHCNRLGQVGWLDSSWPSLKVLGERLTRSEASSSPLAGAIWLDLLDLATRANDLAYAERVHERIRAIRPGPNLEESDSAWDAWNKRFDCRWNNHTGELTLHYVLPAEGTLAGPVFGGRYVGYGKVTHSAAETTVEYRLERTAPAQPLVGQLSSARNGASSQPIRRIRIPFRGTRDGTTVSVTLRNRPVEVTRVEQDGEALLSVDLGGAPMMQPGDKLVVRVRQKNDETTRSGGTTP